MLVRIAWRYIWSKKSTKAIQVISWVSIAAIAIGTAALIIVLSVFNGFEHFVKGMYADFYPSIKITALNGKYIVEDSQLVKKLQSIEGVSNIGRSLEEKTLLSYDEQQAVAILKGVDADYFKVVNFENHIQYGSSDLWSDSSLTPILMGVDLANKLGTSHESVLPLMAYFFSKGEIPLGGVATPYQQEALMVKGIYVMQEAIDRQYVLAPLWAARALHGEDNVLSALEISLTGSVSASKVIERIKLLPESVEWKIESRFEQNKTLYMVLQSERTAVYAILTLMLCIASFNLIGSLSMLVIEKKKDIAVFGALGMSRGRIRRLFLYTGVLNAGIGAVIGMVIAYTICLLQMRFGLVSMGAADQFLFQAYPVRLSLLDFISVSTTIVLVAIVASWVPAQRASSLPVTLRSS